MAEISDLGWVYDKCSKSNRLTSRANRYEELTGPRWSSEACDPLTINLCLLALPGQHFGARHAVFHFFTNDKNTGHRLLPTVAPSCTCHDDMMPRLPVPRLFSSILNWNSRGQSNRHRKHCICTRPHSQR